MRRRAPLVAALVVGLLGLAGCGDDGPAPLSEEGTALTNDQALALAQTRFRLAAEGPFVVRVRVGDVEDVAHLEATATVDPGTHRAWGEVSRGPADLAVAEPGAWTPQEYWHAVDGTWQPSAWPDGHQAPLLLVFGLSADRPENEQLLRQSAARFLGTQQVDGETLEVYRLASESAAGRTRLWLDAEGDLTRLDNGTDDLVVEVLEDEATAEPAELATAWGGTR